MQHVFYYTQISAFAGKNADTDRHLYLLILRQTVVTYNWVKNAF